MISSAERIKSVPEYYFSQKLKEVRAMIDSGTDVINLGIGSPDLPSPDIARETCTETVETKGSDMYQPYNGITDLRLAFSDWYRVNFGVTLSPDNEILPLLGSKEGIMFISLAFLNRGDSVLIPDPGYPAYEATAKLCSARCITYDLKEENGWLPDIDQLERSDLNGIKLMWINYPNMPTGKKALSEDLARIVNFGLKNNILIVNDNPYSFILNDTPTSILSIKGAREIALELNSLSKSHNMAGWRIGMVGGASRYIDFIQKVKSNVDSGMFLPVQKAAIKALRIEKDWYNLLNYEYSERRKLVYQLLDLLDCMYSKDQSGLFVWAKIPPEWQNSDQLSDYLLKEEALFVTPGTVFGVNGSGYIRISLCVSHEKLSEAIERIRSMVHRVRKSSQS